MSDYDAMMKPFQDRVHSLYRLAGKPYHIFPVVYPFFSPLEDEERVKVLIDIFPRSIHFLQTGLSPIGRASEPKRCLNRLDREIRKEVDLVKNVLAGLHGDPALPLPRAYGMDKQIQHLEYMLHCFSLSLGFDHPLVKVYVSCLEWATTSMHVSRAPAHGPASSMSGLMVDKQGTSVDQAEVGSDSEQERMAHDGDVEEDVSTDEEGPSAEHGGDEEMDQEYEQEGSVRSMEGEEAVAEGSGLEASPTFQRAQRTQECRRALHQVKLNALLNESFQVWQDEHGVPLSAQQCAGMAQSFERELAEFYTTPGGQATQQREEGFIAKRVSDLEIQALQATQSDSGDTEWAEDCLARFDMPRLREWIIKNIEERTAALAAASAVQQDQQQDWVRSAAQELEHRRLVKEGRARRLEEGRVTQSTNKAIKELRKKIRFFERHANRLAIKEGLAGTPERLEKIQTKIKENKNTLECSRRELTRLETFLETHRQQVHEAYVFERMQIELNSA